MAEIRVQPKKKTYWWIWVVLVIIVAGVLYYLYETGTLPGPVDAAGDSTVTSGSNVTDTAAHEPAYDSALHFHNGITGQ